MGNTAKSLAIAAALALSVAANATITSYNLVDDPLNFSVSIDYQPGQSAEFYSTSGKWYASAAFIPLGGGIEVIAGSMLHLVAPHANELAPNPHGFNFAFIITAGVASLPNPDWASSVHPNEGHQDSFTAAITPSQLNVYPYTLTLTGSHPVPEPQQFAVLAGLGLLGFGVYRRMRS
ncbi:MAG TPA: hypothetical protein P5534_13635 [Candidatus Paceibacterota bacterium]|nr:hypothetical protein [Candidatus Paceibacterota bacterium]